MSSTTQATPALVLERWNSWVRVYFPETGETRWVDLQESTYDPMPGGDSGSRMRRDA